MDSGWIISGFAVFSLGEEGEEEGGRERRVWERRTCGCVLNISFGLRAKERQRECVYVQGHHREQAWKGNCHGIRLAWIDGRAWAGVFVAVGSG